MTHPCALLGSTFLERRRLEAPLGIARTRPEATGQAPPFVRVESPTYDGPIGRVLRMGRPRMYEQRRTTAVRLPLELHERLCEAASARQVSANLMVERAIAEYLERLLPLEQVVSATR